MRCSCGSEMFIKTHKPNWVPSKKQHHYYKMWHYCLQCKRIVQEDQHKVICNVNSWEQKCNKKVKKQKQKNKQISYKDHIVSDRWKLFSEIVRDMYRKCAKCGITNNLRVHHTNYNNVGREMLKDVCVLCDRCHCLFHSTYKLQRDMDKQTSVFISNGLT